MLKLVKIPPGDMELIVVRDLRGEDGAGRYPATFAELKAKSFPVSALPAAALCPLPVWPRPGERLPVSLVQANFIQGGVLLAWNLFHMTGDSVTYSIWSEVWAEECRRAQGLAISDPVALPAQIFTDRARVRPSEGKNVAVGNHSECITLPCKLIRDEQPLDFEVANCGPCWSCNSSHPAGNAPEDGFRHPPRPGLLLLARKPPCAQRRSGAA